jgi:predicted metal-dependent phosphoesterase TrpH
MLEEDRAWNQRFIDLHTHTTASDGTFSPGDLIDLAHDTGLDALAITDHDTFAGYEAAVPHARKYDFDLIRGIELNTRLCLEDGERRYLHLLAYWPVSEPSPEFQRWLEDQREDRLNRNRRLAQVLQERGINVTLEEAQARGRILTGRPHFARILVEKGYARDSEDAFHRYRGETAPTYVERHSQTTEQAIARVRSGGGIPVVAHPVRLGLSRDLERSVLMRLRDAGLLGAEVYHSEHPPELQAHYRQLAEELGLLMTGGSDFHGSLKPGTQLGTGQNGNVRVPREFLDRMRESVAQTA